MPEDSIENSVEDVPSSIQEIGSDPNEVSERSRRLSRRSKTRALEVIQEFERSLEENPTSSRNTYSYLLIAVLTLSLIDSSSGTVTCNENEQ